MARRASDFGIDDDDIALIARELGIAEPSAVKRAIIAVVNDAIDATQTKAVRRITEKVNLTVEYILRHLKVSQRAGPASDSAILSATKRPVLLSRFDARQEYRASRDRRGRSGSRVKAGVSVSAIPGKRVTMASAFLIKLKSGNGQGVAVRFVDSPSVKKRHWAKSSLDYAVLHGPSVDQLFRAALDDSAIEPDLDALAEAFIRRLAGV